ncbi:MAG: ribosome silencing factor [Steroidobacteraceae bacterium]
MTTPSRPRRAPRRTSALEKTVLAALDDMKAVNVRTLDVRGLTDIADTMIVASGNSDRHVRSIADHVVQRAKASGQRPYGVEGTRDGEWVLVDLQDVLVHVMLPRVREFYGLEQLWEVPAAARAQPAAARKPATPRKPAAPRTAAARPGGARPGSGSRRRGTRPAR